MKKNKKKTTIPYIYGLIKYRNETVKGYKDTQKLKIPDLSAMYYKNLFLDIKRIDTAIIKRLLYALSRADKNFDGRMYFKKVK